MTEPPFKPLGLDHLLLLVRGMAATEHFYCGVLGCSVKHRVPKWGMLELSAGIVLVDIEDPNGALALQGAQPGCNVNHFAILTDDWDEGAMRAWLASNHISIEEERFEEDEQSFYVRDPSGNLVELLRRPARPPAT